MIDFDAIIRECGVKNSDDFVVQIRALHTILVEYNKNVNLTRITEYNDYLIKHVIDSLYIGKFFPELTREKLKLADIGCGAGFPSLILAMAYPNLSITAIDSTAKKTEFVRYAAEILEIPNLEVITGRSRELNCRMDFRHVYDVVCARAVAEAATIFTEAKNFTKKNGRFILYKTPEQTAEDLPKVKKLDSFRKWDATSVFELPENAGARQFLYQK